jgi:hypothetical protein
LTEIEAQRLLGHQEGHLSRPTDSDVFVRKLEELGGSSGNTALMKALDWSSDKYWRVRDALLDDGAVLKGKGKGGSVQLIRELPTQRSPTAPLPHGPEAKLYEPFAKVLRNDWKREERLTHAEVHVTAFGGKKSGVWTRPDITLVSKKHFSVVPESQFDVWTFELKPVAGIDVKAVFEALSHARRATRSFVAFEVPEQPDEKVGEILDRCEEEAERLGVGLLLFTDPADFATWDVRYEGKRQAPNGDLLDEFLLEQIPAEMRLRISGWR